MIYSYGDSFTVGLGTDRVYEDSLLINNPDWNTMSENEKNKNRKLVHKFRNNNCYTKFFADKLKQKSTNKGYIGCNSNYIVDLICNDIVGGEVTDKDIVLVGFTSSLRNYPSFLPHFFTSRPEAGVEGLTFGQSEYDSGVDLEDIGGHMKNTVINKHNGRGAPFWKFLTQYKKTYIKQSFSFSYIDYYNQNLIIFLQALFSHYGIKYIMFDAFDSMVNTSSVDYTKYIKTNTYWGFKKQTIWNFLKEIDEETLLEKRKDDEREISKKHPSKKGHELFAEELYKFYKNRYGKLLI